MISFVFKIQSKSDVITNSSSELFVFKNKDSILDVINLLDMVYPEWRDEYECPKTGKDLDNDDLDWILESISPLHYYWDYEKMDKRVFEAGKRNETLDECNLAKLLGLTVQETFKNWDSWDPTGNEWKNRSLYISDLAYDELREYCEKNNVIALFSIEDNPDWEHQKILMEYADRIHMG